MRRVPAVMMVLVMSGCFRPVPIDPAPCPCTTGYECCSDNVCRASGTCVGDGGGGGIGGGGGSDGGGNPGSSQLELRSLTIQTDGVVPVAAQLRNLSTPAELGVVGESVYVLARENPACAWSNQWVASVSRLEVTAAWTRTWSTVLPVRVKSQHMVVSSDGVTVAGSGELDGQPSRGGGDAWVVRLRPDGSVAWSRQFGSLFEDTVFQLVPLPSGKVVVAGVTGGALEGQVSQGGDDVFIAQLSADGSTDWFQQIGSSAQERFDAVASLEDGSLVVSGWTGGLVEPGRTTLPTGTELFLRRIGPTGAVLWTKQFPSLLEEGSAVSFLSRWGTGLVWGSGYTSLRMARFSDDGAVDWSADAGDSRAVFEVSVLDADRVSLHGVRELPGPALPAHGRPVETFEEVWGSDAGVAVTSGLGGGWPNQSAWTFDGRTVGHRGNSWSVGGTTLSSTNDILSISTFASGNAQRTAHHDWRFTGPQYAQPLPSTSVASPVALGFLQAGSMVTLGRAVFTDCRDQSGIGWLWLTQVP